MPDPIPPRPNYSPPPSVIIGEGGKPQFVERADEDRSPKADLVQNIHAPSEINYDFTVDFLNEIASETSCPSFEKIFGGLERPHQAAEKRRSLGDVIKYLNQRNDQLGEKVKYTIPSKSTQHLSFTINDHSDRGHALKRAVFRMSDEQIDREIRVHYDNNFDIKFIKWANLKDDWQGLEFEVFPPKLT